MTIYLTLISYKIKIKRYITCFQHTVPWNINYHFKREEREHNGPKQDQNPAGQTPQILHHHVWCQNCLKMSGSGLERWPSKLRALTALPAVLSSIISNNIKILFSYFSLCIFLCICMWIYSLEYSEYQKKVLGIPGTTGSCGCWKLYPGPLEDTKCP